MVIKKATPFTKPRSPAYTRKSKKRALNFIKGWLPPKIQKYAMGNLEAYNSGKLNTLIKLVSEAAMQVRDNALEASRKQILRELDKKVGKSNYYFSIVSYPHQVLRENKVLTGAGADRLSKGMQQAFGSVVGNAALIRPGDTLFLVASTKEFINPIREILKKTFPKIPGKKRIDVEIKE
ncbi:MAG: 50S ribosomal protein L16 [Candidatus Pacearchaeota archaeon]